MVRRTSPLFTPKDCSFIPLLTYDDGLEAGRAFGRLLVSRPELATLSWARLAQLAAIIIQSYGVQDPQTTAEILFKELLQAIS
jgi:hypothetical protein